MASRVGQMNSDLCGPARNTIGFMPYKEEGEEGGEEEEEDLGYLKAEALGIAIKVVSKLDLVKELSGLEFLARGGYIYVWRVTYTLVREIDQKNFAYTQAPY